MASTSPALTLSAEQKAYADGRLAHAGLAGRVDVALTDYRDVAGTFDAVASVEMVEAVGQEYWPAYLGSIARMLKPGGRAALQLISIRDDLFDLYAANADFIQTYVFPGGLLIGEARFRALAEAAGLEWRDRERLRRALCRNAEALARALRGGGRRGPPPGRLRRRLPPAVALLSHVLRRRLPRRRHRCRAGDFGQALSRSGLRQAQPERAGGRGVINLRSS